MAATSIVPTIPDNAPFSPEQRAWLNGFLAGLFSRGPAASTAAAPAGVGTPLQPLTIVWGSQTGTCESLAKQAAKAAGQRGFAATVLDMASVTPASLADTTALLVITSTYGDGEPPDNAKALHDALLAPDASPLSPSLNYSVCALGDSNYELFCQCGKNLDESLARLGATRATPRVDCDVDYDAPFNTWLDGALNALQSEDGSKKEKVTTPATAGPTSDFKPHPSSLDAPYGRARPFPAPVITVRNLSGAGSAKEVNHVEFSLAGSGLTYEAGDALAVRPQNCPNLVADVLAVIGADGEEAVATPAGEKSLRVALTEDFDLGKPSADLLTLCGLNKDADCPHVVDALALAATKPAPAALAGALRKLQPRLYSISSSPKAHPDEVHLTVGAVRYDLAGRPRKGVCSTFLAERGLTAGTAGVFVHTNKAFRPPADPSAPMIMVGPGTGIAPFRAFLEERAATAAPGKNWLFFGDQHAATDFLYQDELAAWQASGLLTRLDVAFSRDQAAKVYVQDRMRENAAELWAWLEAGAHFYVCGDAKRMAKDVDAALHDVVAAQGGLSAEDAAAYVNHLKTTRRYARDVY